MSERKTLLGEFSQPAPIQQTTPNKSVQFVNRYSNKFNITSENNKNTLFSGRYQGRYQAASSSTVYGPGSTIKIQVTSQRTLDNLLNSYLCGFLSVSDAKTSTKIDPEFFNGVYSIIKSVKWSGGIAGSVLEDDVGRRVSITDPYMSSADALCTLYGNSYGSGQGVIERFDSTNAILNRSFSIPLSKIMNMAKTRKPLPNFVIGGWTLEINLYSKSIPFYNTALTPLVVNWNVEQPFLLIDHMVVSPILEDFFNTMSKSQQGINFSYIGVDDSYSSSNGISTIVRLESPSTNLIKTFSRIYLDSDALALNISNMTGEVEYPIDRYEYKIGSTEINDKNSTENATLVMAESQKILSFDGSHKSTLNIVNYLGPVTSGMSVASAALLGNGGYGAIGADLTLTNRSIASDSQFGKNSSSSLGVNAQLNLQINFLTSKARTIRSWVTYYENIKIVGTRILKNTN